MSTPCSRARRRAFGEIRAPAAETGSGAAGRPRPLQRPAPSPSCGRVCAAATFARRLLAWLQQPRDRLADRNDVALLRGDAAKNPVALRLDFDDRLVGLDLEQHLALLDLLAFLLLPRNQLARFLRHLERRHHHADAPLASGAPTLCLSRASALPPSRPRQSSSTTSGFGGASVSRTSRQLAADGDERCAGDEQLLGREPRDHFVARRA